MAEIKQTNETNTSVEQTEVTTPPVTHDREPALTDEQLDKATGGIIAILIG